MTASRVRRPLVIGYGNTLRRDDGVGVIAAERLRADPRLGYVDVLAVHQLTPELALDIGDASLVVFIDADVQVAPGDVSRRPLTHEPTSASTHHVGAAQLLALASELTGHAPESVAIGIGVTDLDVGEGISPIVESALAGVVEQVVDLLDTAGTDGTAPAPTGPAPGP